MNFGHFLVGLFLGKQRKYLKKHQKFFTRALAGAVVLLLLNFVVSCYYYKISTSLQPSADELIHLTDLGKRFVMHQGYNARFVDSLTFQKDSMELFLGSTYYQSNDDITLVNPNSVKRYRKKSGDARLLNEVHIYVSPLKSYVGTVWKIAHTDLERLDIYNHSTQHTTGYSILFAIGLIPVAYVAVMLLFLLVMLLSGNSCPFIYTYNGSDFVFAGEIYSGAVYKPLERHDYLLLPDLVEEDGLYKLKISNQLEEVQHTNLLELMVFDHPTNENVLIDKYGIPHSLSDKRAPVSATNLKGENVLALIEAEDDLVYLGGDPMKDPPLLDGLILTFNIPSEAERVDLVIEAKNSYWLDFVYQNFREMLGASYKTWMKRQEDGDPQKMEDWSLSQNIPLSLFLKIDGEWVFQDYYHTVGPMAFKKDILSIDVSERGNGPVQIKLEAGSYFWEIGFAELSLAGKSELVAKPVAIQSAITEIEENVTGLLREDDELYYDQPEIGNEATLLFPVPEHTGDGRTIVLHSKGYYQIQQDPKGAPKIKSLKEIRKSGNFNVYSNELMQEMLAEHVLRNGKMGKKKE